MQPDHQPPQLIRRILASYNLNVQSIGKPQKGYRNQSYPVQLASGQMINLILYKTEPGILPKIHNANRVSNFLAEQGWPVRRTIDSRILQLQARNFKKYCALYNYLPGQTIPWEAYTMEHLKQLGAMMSNMHAALQQLQRQSLPDVTEEYLAITHRMKRYFSDKDVQRALQQKLQLTLTTKVLDEKLRLLELCRHLPHQQPLHMDFVRGNILFSGDDKQTLKISGVLDFEKTAYGSPLFDIARTLAFLLVDCKYKEERKVRKYFLKSGYSKRGKQPLSLVTVRGTDVLEELVELFLLHDFYKFLHHNPYEYLPQNEHFMRTASFLQKCGTVKKYGE